MNLLLLPKELQTIMREFSVERTSKMLLMNELLENHKHREKKYSLCANCRCCADEKYTTYIYWNKYTFCSGWCQYDLESELRK